MKGFRWNKPLVVIAEMSASINRRFFWLKYILVFAIVFTTTFVLSNRSLMDYLRLEERYLYINKEIEREQELLSADSLRLNELKSLGKSVENIARERYLMKAPGEEVFIIKKPDSVPASH